MLVEFVVASLLGGTGLCGRRRFPWHPICFHKHPLGVPWAWFPGLQGMQGDVCSSFSRSLDGMHTEAVALASGAQLPPAEAQSRSSAAHSTEVFAYSFPWGHHGTPSIRLSASHRCLRTLSPAPALSSGVFQGSSAHWHLCSRRASPDMRTEHPLHVVCFSLLLYLWAG